ncbi:MAG: hypothetical protein MJA83_18505 [Gammaproteobacteria bacterium]|nr:hypothetical protein [Gammaproteobacteria bacterium]
MTVEDAQKDLAYIRAVMADTRRATCLSGKYFIAWGLASAAGLLGTWLYLRGIVDVSPLVTWAFCIVAGWIYSAYAAIQEAREAALGSAGRFIGVVWTACGVAVLIIFFIAYPLGALQGGHNGVAATIVGVGVFITGALSGMPWLRNTALGWWLGAAVMFLWPGEHTFLIMGVLLLILYIIPGVLLNRQHQQYQQQLRQENTE